MASVLKNLRGRAAWAAAVACLVVAGCGGGGGGDVAVAPSVQIKDSFGNVVAAGGGDGVGPGDSGGDGTAGDGAAIVGGLVTVTDVNGKSVSATTDTQGYYRVKMTGMTAPFVIGVKRPDGIVRHSLSVKAPAANAFINMNISGITDKVASDVARAGGRSGAADLTPQIVASNAAVIDQSLSNIRSTLATVISAANVSNFDPLATPFRPDGKGIDFVLDNTKIVIAADGSTQVSVSPTFKPPVTTTGLAGTWRMFVTAEGQTVDTQADFPGASVPTAETLAGYGVAQFGSLMAPTPVNGTGYTVAVNGNTVTVTGPNTNYTVVINSFQVSNYQSCGACGVGSAVSFTIVVNSTQGGLLDGFNEPSTTETGSASLSWKRIN